MEPDAVADDNQVFAAFYVPPFEPVLIIDDSLDASTSLFLRTALAPGDRVLTGITPRVEKARFLSTNDLSAFRSIYLLDTASLEPQAVTSIEEFVQNGGGLCIFTGPHTDPLMAQKWFRDGKGFFPVVLDQTEELPPYYAAPDIRVSPHPIFRIFSGEHATQFNTIHVERYYTLDDATLETVIPLQDETTLTQKNRHNSKKTSENSGNSAFNTVDSASNAASDSGSVAGSGSAAGSDSALGSDVHVIAALRNNAPLVVERAFGRGKIVLFLTSADRTWTDWPVGNPSQPNPFTQGSYVVMILQLQAYLTQRPTQDFRVGEPLSTEFSPELFDASVRFLNPDASVWKLVQSVAQKNGMFQATSPPAAEPGVFQAEMKGLSGIHENRLFAVNVDVRESSLTKITPQELAAEMHETRFDLSTIQDFHFAVSDSARSALSDWILVLILIWMVLEMLLAANASYHLSGNSAEKQMKKKSANQKETRTKIIGGEK